MIFSYNQKLMHALGHMAEIEPPTGFIGHAISDAMWQDWLRHFNVSQAHFIEADEKRYQALSRQFVGRPSGWQAHQQFLWSEAGPRAYYRANLGFVNGPLPLDAMQPLWPHLQAVETLTQEAYTLDQWGLQQPGIDRCNWLLIGHLYPLMLLQGGTQLLSNIHVIIAPVLRQIKNLPKEATGAQALDDYLAQHQFRFLGPFDAAHPKIALRIYFRDWRSGYESLIKEQEKTVQGLVKDHEKVIKQLETKNQSVGKSSEEMALRQRLCREEMLKAEAQIELIKDVLLRESVSHE